MNVIFLDYDGVVNTPQWTKKADGTFNCRYNFPEDGKVNDWQSVQWVSEFCQRYGYSIVVSSTWRTERNYKECLVNGGLRNGIEVLGRTPDCGPRGDEIATYLREHPEITGYLIFDDETDMSCYFSENEHYTFKNMNRLVKCQTDKGFKQDEFIQAESLHFAFNAGQREP
jgi:hypothetical protein